MLVAGLVSTSVVHAAGYGVVDLEKVVENSTYLKQQNAEILKVGLQNLQDYYNTNSDRDKGRVMLNVLKNLEAKSAEKEVFTLPVFKNFYTIVLLDTEG